MIKAYLLYALHNQTPLWIAEKNENNELTPTEVIIDEFKEIHTHKPNKDFEIVVQIDFHISGDPVPRATLDIDMFKYSELGVLDEIKISTLQNN